MSFKKASLVAMLAASMTSAPVLAQTASTPTTVEAARSGAAMDDASELRGRGGWVIPLLALIAVILGIIAAVSDGGDRPVSP